MPDDLMVRARRAAALAPAERDRLITELVDEVERLYDRVRVRRAATAGRSDMACNFSVLVENELLRAERDRLKAEVGRLRREYEALYDDRVRHAPPPGGRPRPRPAPF